LETIEFNNLQALGVPSP